MLPLCVSLSNNDVDPLCSSYTFTLSVFLPRHYMTFRLPTVVSGLTQSVTQLSYVVTGRGGDAKYFQTTKKGEVGDRNGISAAIKL